MQERVAEADAVYRADLTWTMRCRRPDSTQATHGACTATHECLVRPSMVGEAAIIGQQLRLTALADVPIEGVLLLPSGV